MQIIPNPTTLTLTLTLMLCLIPCHTIPHDPAARGVEIYMNSNNNDDDNNA